MACNTAANSSFFADKFSSTKSLSLASSANRTALLTAFAAWAALWRAVADEHADQLQKAVQAAAVWRSQMRSGKFGKAADNTDLVTASREASGEEVKISRSQKWCDVPVEEDHAAELQRALDAASAWRSRIRSAGSASKAADNTDLVTASRQASGEEVKNSLSQKWCDIPVEEDDAELQRALDAATAWRSRIRSAGSASKAATTQSSCACRLESSMSNSVDVDANVAPTAPVSAGHGDDLAGNLLESPSPSHEKPILEAVLDAAHDAELQAAVDAAANWRSRFQRNYQARENKVESTSPPQNESSHESSSLCDSSEKKKCTSPLAAILMGESCPESTMASSDEGTSASSNSSEGAPTCWVQGAFLRDVSRILADGLRSKGPRVRLYAGPWGRSGLCRRNEEVLVYIDVPKARKAGAEFRFVQRGLVLVAGVIPAACCRKMVMIKDGSVLFDRNPVEPEQA